MKVYLKMALVAVTGTLMIADNAQVFLVLRDLCRESRLTFFWFVAIASSSTNFLFLFIGSGDQCSN